MRIRNVGKGAAVAGMTVALLAGSVASAAFLARGVFHYGVDAAELQPLEVGTPSISRALLPSQSANLVFRVKNTNPIPVRATATAYENQITSNVEGCAEYLDLTAGRHTGATGLGEGGKSYLYYETLAAGESRNVTVSDAVTLRDNAPHTCMEAQWDVRVNTDAHGGTE